MKFKAYHKIKQFKDVIRNICIVSDYKGLDEEGNPIYESSVKPTLNFKGTVKLHGTNAGICYTPEKGIVAQKRSSLLNPENLGNVHFGFNNFVQVTYKNELTDFMKSLYSEHCVEGDQITLYGEWAGKGVQKSVGISEFNKGFYFFDCKVFNINTEEEKWVDISDLKSPVKDVYNIHDFETFNIEIDFNNPGLVQNQLIDVTNKVEEECPVAKEKGKTQTIGEGVVWTAYWKGQKYIMKVKGQKHSTSKVKKLASVNPEVLKNILDFVDYACTKNRIEQGIMETGAIKPQQIPDLLKWVANDIITEESDTMLANNLEWKQVAKECSTKTRNYFLNKINQI